MILLGFVTRQDPMRLHMATALVVDPPKDDNNRSGCLVGLERKGSSAFCARAGRKEGSIHNTGTLCLVAVRRCGALDGGGPRCTGN